MASVCVYLHFPLDTLDTLDTLEGGQLQRDELVLKNFPSSFLLEGRLRCTNV